MLAWCVLSTLIIILLTIRRWLLRKLVKDSRCDLCIPATHEDTQDTFDVPQTSATPQPTPQDTEDNPVVPQTSATPQPTLTPQPADVVVQLHSPPSLYTTPSSSTATPPTASTDCSTKPLVTPEGAIAKRTRLQMAKKLPF